MSNGLITREQIVVESVNMLVRNALAAYPSSMWEMLPSYPYNLEKLEPNTAKIACGFTFDDGGHLFELGSNMKQRAYTIEFFIFGATLTLAQNMSDAIKFAIEQDQVIPIYDITQVPAALNGEWMELDHVHSRRQPVPDPEPWQEFTFYVAAQVTDWYTPPPNPGG